MASRKYLFALDWDSHYLLYFILLCNRKSRLLPVIQKSGQEDKKMATLSKSPKKNLRAVFFMACVILVVFNTCALAHTDVTAEQARDLIESTSDLIVVDVREPYEYCDDIGHIPRALNYPLSSGILEARFEELPKDGPVLVVCRSGGRSNQAANFLDSMGFSMVYDMLRGMSAWIWETEPCKEDDDSETASAETNTYVFLPGQSTVVQTGGIAGVHKTYPIQGQFQLKVDVNATVALFGYVDAFLLSPVSSSPPQNLSELFNMAMLTGAVIDDTTISFTGKAVDGSDVLITVTIEDNLAYLVGQTTPPPNSADFFLFSLNAVAQRKYGGGTGEPNNPYLIYTAEQMNAIGVEPNDWDKHFKLMANVDLSEYTGDEFNIIGYYVDWDNNKPFTGVFDGNDHTISNFTYTSTDRDYVGLFGYVADPNTQINNMGLIDPNVDAGTGDCVGSLVGRLGVGFRRGDIVNCYCEGGSVSGFQFVGGLVGFHNWRSTITNCYATSTVLGVEDVGGLVGANDGIITNCYAIGNTTSHRRLDALAGSNEGTISNCYSMGSVSGDRFVGGLVGQNGGTYSGREGMAFPGDIDNCYSRCSVTGTAIVGGLVGYNNVGTITKCHATGRIMGTVDVGGLVGVGNRLEFWSEEVTFSFWDTQTSGQVTSDGGIGKTTTEMQTAGTFLNAGWDFMDETVNGTDDIWWIDEGQDYPRLWWEP